MDQTPPYRRQFRKAFLDEADLPRFTALLEGDRPVELEVGSGKGLFLRSAAASSPETQFVGLEIAAKYAAACNAKLTAAGLGNAVCFCADAVLTLDRHVPPARLDAVHVYFPDPWWKARHKKRRVLNETLVAAADRALRPGGKFHFWTDVLDYYESTLELVASQVPWGGPHAVEEQEPVGDMDYRTHFERRTRLGGLPVYRTYWVKSPPTFLPPLAPASGERGRG